MKSVTEHLKDRYLNVELHRPVVDEANRVATFYLWNLSGQICGYQQYRPEGCKKPNNNPKEGKYFTYRKQPTLALWGVESLYLTPKLLFVCEGLFDAARLTNRGISAVAVLSNDPGSDFRNWVLMLNRYVVVVCDNDIAGEKLAKYGDVFVYPPSEKDLGDSDEQFVTILVKEFV